MNIPSFKVAVNTWNFNGNLFSYAQISSHISCNRFEKTHENQSFDAFYAHKERCFIVPRPGWVKTLAFRRWLQHVMV